MKLVVRGARPDIEPVVVWLEQSGDDILVRASKGDEANYLLRITGAGVKLSANVDPILGFKTDKQGKLEVIR